MDRPTRALSVRQPWASLIADGRKTIELRSWPTKYRGPIVIVSGSALWRGEHGFPIDGPRGVTLCTAELVDVRLATPDDAVAACLAPPVGWYAWALADATLIEHVPHKGRLGLYRYGRDSVREFAA